MTRQTTLWRLLFIIATAAGCWDLKFSELPDTEGANVNIDSDDSDRIDNPCRKKTCFTPPNPDKCLTPDTVVRYAVNGYCEVEDGKAICRYPTYPEKCARGSCRDGVCEAVPLQGKYCIDPPAPTCDGNELVSHYPIGVAAQNSDGDPVCEYPEHRISCENGCKEGRCSGDPCAGLFCTRPLASFCETDYLTIPEMEGRCSNEGACIYKSRGDDALCADACRDGKIDEAALCDCITCVTPPADFCLDEKTLYDYPERGICKNGACIYEGQRIACGSTCSKGRCRDDLCLGFSCIHLPAPKCTAEGRLKLHYFNTDTPCREGLCDFDEFIVCDERGDDCVDGRCKSDVCSGIQPYCTYLVPQNPHCDGDQAISFISDGTCIGDGFCSYEIETVDCEACDAGVCTN
jgi:hypothetical protein